jgi:hypothetical protein
MDFFQSRGTAEGAARATFPKCFGDIEFGQPCVRLHRSNPSAVCGTLQSIGTDSHGPPPDWNYQRALERDLGPRRAVAGQPPRRWRRHQAWQEFLQKSWVGSRNLVLVPGKLESSSTGGARPRLEESVGPGAPHEVCLEVGIDPGQRRGARRLAHSQIVILGLVVDLSLHLRTQFSHPRRLRRNTVGDVSPHALGTHHRNKAGPLTSADLSELNRQATSTLWACQSLKNIGFSG